MMVNPNLRGIANYGVGYNNIDLIDTTELGIPVSNTPGVLTETTAGLAWALLMATARKVPQGQDCVLFSQWGQRAGKSFMGVDIGPGGFNRSKVLGIIDLGGIGQAVMRRSRGFGVVDRFRRVLFTAVTMREVTKGMTKNLKP